MLSVHVHVCIHVMHVHSSVLYVYVNVINFASLIVVLLSTLCSLCHVMYVSRYSHFIVWPSFETATSRAYMYNHVMWAVTGPTPFQSISRGGYDWIMLYSLLLCTPCAIVVKINPEV